MHRKYIYIAVLALCFGVNTTVHAGSETIIAASGTSKVSLLELYSSESCSSCPPADKWISKLEFDKDLWRKFVPVVFHVDYWNHLSWKDELSSSDMTARQIAISKTWTQPSVYTPAVLLDGSEWSSWRDSPLSGRLVKEKSKLNLSIIKNSAGLFWVQVSGQTPGVKYIVHLAKLGVGISSKISDGENAGKTLVHNFVALEWQNQTLSSAVAKQIGTMPIKFSKTNKQIAKKYAVVAWIEEVGRYSALQATGAYL